MTSDRLSGYGRASPRLGVGRAAGRQPDRVRVPTEIAERPGDTAQRALRALVRFAPGRYPPP